MPAAFSGPGPSNQPRAFWAPWAAIPPPTAKRAPSSAISRIIGFKSTQVGLDLQLPCYFCVMIHATRRGPSAGLFWGQVVRVVLLHCLQFQERRVELNGAHNVNQVLEF